MCAYFIFLYTSILYVIHTFVKEGFPSAVCSHLSAQEVNSRYQGCGFGVGRDVGWSVSQKDILGGVGIGKHVLTVLQPRYEILNRY